MNTIYNNWKKKEIPLRCTGKGGISTNFAKDGGFRMRVTSDFHTPVQGILDWFGSLGRLKGILRPTLFQVEPFKSWELSQKWQAFQTEEDPPSVRKPDSVTLGVGEPLVLEEPPAHERTWVEYIEPLYKLGRRARAYNGRSCRREEPESEPNPEPQRGWFWMQSKEFRCWAMGRHCVSFSRRWV